MVHTAKDIVADALLLPAEVRMGLVEKLLSSLNLPTQKGVENAWVAEAEKRIADIAQGKVELVPGDQVFRRVQQKYKR